MVLMLDGGFIIWGQEGIISINSEFPIIRAESI